MGNKQQDVFDELEGIIIEEARKKYSERVIDHFMNPRNQGVLDAPDCESSLSGICGDTIKIYIGLEGDRIERISFVTNGCGPTIACASAVTCLARGLAISEAMQITGKTLIDYLGGLPIENTHCADLAVNTLRSALAKVC